MIATFLFAVATTKLLVKKGVGSGIDVPDKAFLPTFWANAFFGARIEFIGIGVHNDNMPDKYTILPKAMRSDWIPRNFNLLWKLVLFRGLYPSSKQ